MAEKCLKMILANDKEGSYGLIERLLGEGISIEDIHLYVFEAVLKEVGYLWETNQIDVAEEHI